MPADITHTIIALAWKWGLVLAVVLMLVALTRWRAR